MGGREKTHRRTGRVPADKAYITWCTIQLQVLGRPISSKCRSDLRVATCFPRDLRVKMSIIQPEVTKVATHFPRDLRVKTDWAWHLHLTVYSAGKAGRLQDIAHYRT